MVTRRASCCNRWLLSLARAGKCAFEDAPRRIVSLVRAGHRVAVEVPYFAHPRHRLTRSQDTRKSTRLEDNAVTTAGNNPKSDRFATAERERPRLAVRRHPNHGSDPAVRLDLPGARDVGAFDAAARCGGRVLSAGRARVGGGENEAREQETAHGVLLRRSVTANMIQGGGSVHASHCATKKSPRRAPDPSRIDITIDTRSPIPPACCPYSL